MGLLDRGNRALGINGLPGYERELTEDGSNWLWAVTAVFVLCFILIHIHAFFAKAGEKIFHYIYTLSLLTGSIAYFAMASNLGWNGADQANEEDRGDPRQMFWVKYVYWVVSFPTVALCLGLVSGVSWATMAYWVALTWTWVISYLVAAYVSSNYRWGFFVFGTVSWLLLSSSLCMDGRQGAKRIETTKHFQILSCWVQLLWLLYPIGFGLTDGGNYLSVTSMFIWFGILDLLMVPVLAFATVYMAAKWDFGKMNLYFTQYGRVRQGGTFPEKDVVPATGAQAA